MFEATLEARELGHERLSVSALATRLCELSRGQNRRCCYAHFEDECAHCRGRGTPRPDVAAWPHITEEVPIIEAERDVVGRFRKALDEARHGGRPRPRAALPPPSERGLPRMPPPRQERQPEELHVVPSCPPSGRASEPSTGDGAQSDRPGAERRDPDALAAGSRGYHRGEEWRPRYGERGQRYQREELGRRVESEERQESAASAQLLARMADRLDRLER
jgi:hypothetical protein